jgi:hypothetical protein
MYKHARECARKAIANALLIALAEFYSNAAREPWADVIVVAGR